MYLWTLLLHSWIRWAVLGLAPLAVGRSAAGLAGRRDWLPADDRVIRLFGITLDVQVLLGLLLYFVLSPITRGALSEFGEAMRISAWRFWAVEHGLGMIVAVALAHIGKVRARKATDPRKKHKTVLIFCGLALLAIVISTPWPGRPYGRELFRW
jgi:uncharacterized membrane protein